MRITRIDRPALTRLVDGLYMAFADETIVAQSKLIDACIEFSRAASRSVDRVVRERLERRITEACRPNYLTHGEFVDFVFDIRHIIG